MHVVPSTTGAAREQTKSSDGVEIFSFAPWIRYLNENISGINGQC